MLSRYTCEQKSDYTNSIGFYTSPIDGTPFVVSKRRDEEGEGGKEGGRGENKEREVRVRGKGKGIEDRSHKDMEKRETGGEG